MTQEYLICGIERSLICRIVDNVIARVLDNDDTDLSVCVLVDDSIGVCALDDADISICALNDADVDENVFKSSTDAETCVLVDDIGDFLFSSLSHSGQRFIVVFNSFNLIGDSLIAVLGVGV
jgi:hypothetical protein